MIAHFDCEGKRILPVREIVYGSRVKSPLQAAARKDGSFHRHGAFPSLNHRVLM